MTMSIQVYTQEDIKNAFSQRMDHSSIAQMVQAFVLANQSPTPLTQVVTAFFQAITAGNDSLTKDPYIYVGDYLGVSMYFSASVVHAGVAGPMAGLKALQMQILKYSSWNP